jgi:SAM-dependent methyltransferase
VKLREPLPANRTLDQIKNHYLVETAIAKRLKESSREERKQIYATMYDELFRQVPDHPRLTRREDKQKTLIVNKDKLDILRKFLDNSMTFAEFAPGDCKFSMEVAKYVRTAYAVDISDQRKLNDIAPPNFNLIIYNGYSLDEIKENSVDLVFSDQLIEHFHPEETKSHFELVYRILKKGGKYVFRTPHAFSVPYDVSRYFSDEPEGFHLKEWTYIELKHVIKEIGYLKFITYWSAKGTNLKLANLYFELFEKILGLFPKRSVRAFAKYAIPTILCVATK